MNLYIHKFDIEIERAEGINRWIDQLREFFVAHEVISGPNIRFLTSADAATFASIECKNALPYLESINTKLEGKLVVICKPDSKLANICKLACPEGLYGATFVEAGTAYVYDLNNPYTFWHESFHLYGAKDCYIVKGNKVINPGPVCGETDCIMQYGISRQSGGIRPWLCKENLTRIKASTS